MLGVAVGEDEDVGAPQYRRDLGVLDEAGEEADRAARPRGGRAQRLERPSAGCRRSRARRPRCPRRPRAGCRAPCRGGAGRRRGSPGPRARRARAAAASRLEPGQVVEGAVMDHADPRRVEPDLGPQALGAVLGVGDDRVHPAEGAVGARDLAAARAAAAGRSARSSPGAAPAGSAARRARAPSATGSGRRRRSALRLKAAMSGRCSAILNARRPGASRPRAALRR